VPSESLGSHLLCRLDIQGLAGITAHYEKLQAEDQALEEAIKAAELAVD